MTGHSVLSPSGADRWSNCLGSLAACKHIGKSPDSPASLLGSAKHAISELVLRNPHMQTIDAMVGQTWHLSADKKLERTPSEGCYAFEIDDEFADHCKVYIDYVNSRPGQKRCEVFLSAAHIYGVDDQGGTSDCEHLDFAAREIEIIDAKFGFIHVGAKHKQLRIYGAASLLLHDLEGDWDTVRCTIVQPQDVAEPVKSHVYTRAEIVAFVEGIRPIAQDAYRLWSEPPADLAKYLTPGPVQCAWCPIADKCNARNQRIANMFEDNTTKHPDAVLMTDQQLAELYPLLPDISEWVSQIAAEADRRAQLGTKIPGHKLIYGRKGPRKFVEGAEEQVEGVLCMALGEADMYQPRKLVTPTAAEAALKKAGAPGLYETLKPFVTQSEPRLKLVPESTKGEPVNVTKVEF
jgi:hypothetical protein